MNIRKKVKAIPKWLKIAIVIGLFVAGGIAYLVFKNSTSKPSYQTQTVEKGTIIVSVSGTGTVTAANSVSATSKASGVVKKIYARDGDSVKVGDVIAEIELDLAGQQQSAQALASYQSAQNAVESAKASMLSLQADMFTQWDEFRELSSNSTYTNGDGTDNYTNRALPEFHISEKTWLSSEAKYKNQQNVVNQAQTASNAAWKNYQESSPKVYAPISGKVTGMAFEEGSVLSGTTSSNDTSSRASSKFANIVTDAPPIVTVNLSESDVMKVVVGDKTIVTFDAIPDKTFSGSISSIDTAGTVSSGVTTYAATIKLLNAPKQILPNMAAATKIITEVKNNVIVVPSEAVTTANDTQTVQVLKNGTPQSVMVTTGLESDSQVEVISGLSEGEVIVTGNTSSSSGSSNASQTRSPFSSFGGGGARMR